MRIKQVDNIQNWGPFSLAPPKGGAFLGFYPKNHIQYIKAKKNKRIFVFSTA
jgi:hypothetical protein